MALTRYVSAILMCIGLYSESIIYASFYAVGVYYFSTVDSDARLLVFYNVQVALDNARPVVSDSHG